MSWVKVYLVLSLLIYIHVKVYIPEKVYELLCHS